MTSMGHFHPCWGSLSRTDGDFGCNPVSSLSEQCGQCIQKRETQSMASTVSSPSPPVSSPHLLYFLLYLSRLKPYYRLCFFLSGVLSSPLSLSPSPLFLIYSSCFFLYLSFPPPLSALHAFALPLYA